ncbi:MAG: CDP-glycerol glycerophosphotransferase family protein [Friedmanniella sp.]
MPRLSTEQAKVRARRVLRKARSSSNPALYHGYRLARRTARDTVKVLTGRQVGWMATLRSARWVDESTYEVSGWAYERGYAYLDGPPPIEVWVESGKARIDATVQARPDTEANALAVKAEFDYANTGFVARLDLSTLPQQDDRTWVVKIKVGDRLRNPTGPFKYRYRGGSARHLFAHTFADDRQVIPTWRRGLRFVSRQAAVMATEISLDGRAFRASVRTHGPVLTSASLIGSLEEVPLTCQRLEDAGEGCYEISGVVPEAYRVLEGRTLRSAIWGVAVQGEDGTSYRVRTSLDDTLATPPPEATLFASSAAGTLRLNDAPTQVLVEDYAFELEPRLGLRLRGRVLGAGGEPPTLYVVGPRQNLPAELTMAADGTFESFVPLLVSVWGQQPLPPRTGGYLVKAASASGEELRVSCHPTLTVRTPQTYDAQDFRLRVGSGVLQQLRLRVLTARRPDELGSFHQQRLWNLYRTADWQPRNAVYFESFYGRNATCNPRALDGEIARRYPQLTRFWGIDDASIPIPEGAIPVVRGTREWWEARATSRYVVANDWLRRQFRPRPFQVVLQTWHGSMLKRIGLDRPNVPVAKQQVILRERSKWDLLLSQNHHSTEILASAYAWDRPIMEEGYPRDDPLSTETGEELRDRLGIAPDKTVVLYAPTWRENLTSMVTFLDLESLTRDLGEDYVLLLRGHSRTVAYGGNVTLPGVIDVTTYPDITELFLASDVLITDYSSVMFDFSVTRRPMIFFVPDMDDYRDSVRGVYFDLSEVAPGPVLYTQDEVTVALRELDQQREKYAELYEAWVQRFNHHDDGHAAERIVRQLLAVTK